MCASERASDRPHPSPICTSKLSSLSLISQHLSSPASPSSSSLSSPSSSSPPFPSSSSPPSPSSSHSRSLSSHHQLRCSPSSVSPHHHHRLLHQHHLISIISLLITSTITSLVITSTITSLLITSTITSSPPPLHPRSTSPPPVVIFMSMVTSLSHTDACGHEMYIWIYMGMYVNLRRYKTYVSLYVSLSVAT